jgi:hypothetical protein
MDKIFGNITAAFRSEQEMGDAAGFIDEILFIVGIALAAVAISSWIGGAAMNKGADIASCISGQSVAAGATTSTSADCQGGTHEAKKSFKDSTYTTRFK